MACRSSVSAKNLEFRLALITDNDAVARIHRKVNLDSPSALQLEVEVSIHDHNPPGERALYGLTPTDIRHLAYAGTGANRQSDKQTGWPED